MLVKGYEETMAVTPQQRLAAEYAKRNTIKTEINKPMEGDKCQTKKKTTTRKKK